MHSLKLLLPVAEALGWAVLLLKLQGAEEGTSSLTFPPREYLSTRSSLSTNTSFGQTRSTSVYNRHYKWLLTPRNWALQCVSQQRLLNLFVVQWMRLGLHPLCFQRAAMSLLLPSF